MCVRQIEQSSVKTSRIVGKSDPGGECGTSPTPEGDNPSWGDKLAGILGQTRKRSLRSLCPACTLVSGLFEGKQIIRIFS
jgi:hypothetical protein